MKEFQDGDLQHPLLGKHYHLQDIKISKWEEHNSYEANKSDKHITSGTRINNKNGSIMNMKNSIRRGIFMNKINVLAVLIIIVTCMLSNIGPSMTFSKTPLEATTR